MEFHQSSAKPKESFWHLRLTRTTACLMSLFGPVLLLIPFILAGVAFHLLGLQENGAFVTVAVVGFVAAIVIMRIYFARWYVLDKHRHPAWSALAIVGFWGWVGLWVLADRKNASVVAAPVPAG